MSRIMSYTALGIVVFFVSRMIWKIFYIIGAESAMRWYDWRDRKALEAAQK